MLPFRSRAEAEIEVDIKKYPSSRSQIPGDTLTVGDIDGNVMKLVWILQREGAINISEANFKKLWEIYDKRFAINKKDVGDFCGILNTAVEVNPGFDLRLIGDIFSDRGSNDYLSLKFLEKLRKGGVNFEIVYSNHDSRLLRYYHDLIVLSRLKTIDHTYESIYNRIFTFKDNQQNSLEGLLNYLRQEGDLNNQIKAGKEFEELIQNIIIPSIKLMSYSLADDKTKIDLFMHAPNNYGIIKELMKEFGVSNKDPRTAEEMARSIDEINKNFKDLYNSLWLSKEKWLDKSKDSNLLDLIENSNSGFIWQRLKNKSLGYGEIDLKTYPKEGFIDHIVHGHTPAVIINSSQVNLDTKLGKDNESKGKYVIFSKIGHIPAEAINWIEGIESLEKNEFHRETKEKLHITAKAAYNLLNGYFNPEISINKKNELYKDFLSSVAVVRKFLKSVGQRSMFTRFDEDIVIDRFLSPLFGGHSIPYLNSIRELFNKEHDFEKLKKSVMNNEILPLEKILANKKTIPPVEEGVISSSKKKVIKNKIKNKELSWISSVLEDKNEDMKNNLSYKYPLLTPLKPKLIKKN